MPVRVVSRPETLSMNTVTQCTMVRRLGGPRLSTRTSLIGFSNDLEVHSRVPQYFVGYMPSLRSAR